MTVKAQKNRSGAKGKAQAAPSNRPPDPDAGFVHDMEERLINAFIRILQQEDPEGAALFSDKRALEAQEDKARRRAGYVALWDGLDGARQYKLAAHDARYNHLRRLARIMGTTALVQAHNSIKPVTAGSIDYVLERFRAENVAAGQVQKFIDENAVAWFSLTGHPTNPATLAYTEAQTHLAQVLADMAAGPGRLDGALRKIMQTPPVGAHKAPLEEAQETLNTLNVIFDSALVHKDLFDQALSKHGYESEGVRVRRALIRPRVWTLGDGDGNANLTAAVLDQGIALHRRHILRRYVDFCAAAPDVPGDVTAAFEDLLCDAEQKCAPARFHEKALSIRHMLKPGSEIAYLVDCFGFGFGQIDLRHNAVDIMTAVRCMIEHAGIMDARRYDSLGLAQQVTMLAAWLEDDEVLAALRQLAPADLTPDSEDIDPADEGAVAARLLARAQVMARHPDMCEKLIIAETTCPAHVLAAMLLLKAAGHEIAGPDSHIDLVVLSESVADLTSLGALIETLLENESFRAHVVARGRLLAMIAKSDTTRQDGRGEAEYAQYEAAVDIFHAVDKMQRKYPALEELQVSIKNGGGHALQRGGGRVTEIPAIHGRAAADARVTDCGPSTLTIQGQQQQILFCPGATALGTLEALAAQNLYTKAGIQGEMPIPSFAKTMNKQYARADARLFAKIAGQAFDALTKNNPALDDLLVAAPWLAMKAGNVSSRPAKRGEKLAGPGITPRQAKGDQPRALSGRAISGERLTGHACLPVFSVLGMVEAMTAVREQGAARLNPDKYGDALHHLYRANKLHRDGARATISAAAMADFDIAWPLLTGRERPAPAQVKGLAAQFVNPAGTGQNSPAVTLAYLERYFLETERLTYEMVSGQKAPRGFSHGDALRRLWPALARQVAGRDRAAEFARVIETVRTRRFDEAPDQPLSEQDYRITQALYMAANVVNAPVGILATRTRLEPVYEVGRKGRTRFMRPQSYQEQTVAHLLQIPPSLTDIAK